MPLGQDGIQLRYTPDVTKSPWYMHGKTASQLNSDTRVDAGTSILGNATDGFYVTDPDPRINIKTISLYNRQLNCNGDHGVWASRGYMFDANDIRDFEMTGYYRWVDAPNSTTRISQYGRSGEHSTAPCCTGTKYTNRLQRSGNIAIGKEQWHNEYADYRNNKTLTQLVPLEDFGWFGMKCIMYNISIGGGRQGVKIEHYIDFGNETNQWILVNETIDNGGWGAAGGQCDGEPDQIILWGGPYNTFRMDEQGEIRFKKFSVVPISTTAAPPPPPPPVNPTDVLFSVSFPYNIGTTNEVTCEPVLTNPNPPQEPPPPGKVNITKKVAFGHSYL